MKDVQNPAAVPEAATVPPSRAYRRYVIYLLLLVYTLNFIDRNIVSILAEPIKEELHLADWQLGMVTGLAFALFYAVLGLPFARIAERGDRPIIIAAALAVWSGFTVACGFAQNFIHLVLARFGVGVGEAGCTPTAVSLIADMTPKEERAGAMAIYTLGAAVGSCLGLIIGGLVAGGPGWRVAFMVAGAPGLLVALLVLTTLAEPRRRILKSVTVEHGSLLSTARALGAARSYRFVVAAEVAMSFANFGLGAFISSFFLRNHGQELARTAQALGMQSIGVVGVALGLVMGVGGAIGALSGGFVADRLAKRDLRAYVVLPAITCLAAVPLYVVALLTSSIWPAFVALGVATALASMYFGPGYAVIQGVANERSRATATALLIFCCNLIGLGLGPLIVGALSDLFAGAGGDTADGIRRAMVWCLAPMVAAAACFWTARKTVRADIRY